MKNLSTKTTQLQASFFIQNLSLAVENTKNSTFETGSSNHEVNNKVLTLANESKFYAEVLDLIRRHEERTPNKWVELPDTVKGLQMYLTLIEYLGEEQIYSYNNLESAYILAEHYNEE